MAEYRFLFDESFLIQACRKNRRQHGTLRVFLVIKSVACLLVLGLAALSVAHRAWWLTALFVAAAILGFNGHQIDLWRLKRRFRKSPYKDDDLVITLTADGVHALGSKSDSKLTWAVFTKACQFGDGFLLFQGPGLYNWLPTSALVDGSTSEVESLIRDNVRHYKMVEQMRVEAT